LLNPHSAASEPGGTGAGSLPLALATATVRIAGESDDGELGRVVVEEAARLLQADDVRLELLDRDAQWLVVHAAIGRARSEVGARHRPSESVLGRVLHEGAGLLIPDAAAVADPPLDGYGSMIAVPLQSKGAMLGGLQAARAAGQPPFTAADQATLQVLAEVVAARLGAAQQVMVLTGRAQELLDLDPAWRPLVEEAGDYVLVVDLQGQVVDADEAACRALDYPREALLHRTMQDLVPLPPGVNWQSAMRPVMEQVLGGQVLVFDSTMRRRDGSLAPQRIRLQGFQAPAGPVIRGVVRDLTLEKQLQVRAFEEEKMRLLSEIGAGLAHAINTPLAIVLGNTELLLDDVTEPDERALLSPAYEAARRIEAVVKVVQGFSRPHVTGTWAEVDLPLLVRETVELTRSMWEEQPRAQGRPIQLQVEASPMPMLRANPVELREVLRELLANAVQALPAGGTIVVCTKQADGQVLLSVADNGVGMSEAVRQHCTDPFFTTRRPLGHGLGLTRVYDTALRHEGELQVESVEGEGTRVTVRLPLPASGDSPGR
jgi:PAS domain S-box-containing protein